MLRVVRRYVLFAMVIAGVVVMLNFVPNLRAAPSGAGTTRAPGPAKPHAPVTPAVTAPVTSGVTTTTTTPAHAH